MKQFVILTLVILLCNLHSYNSYASERSSAGCDPGKSSAELFINNIRTTINTGGDMWWDLQSTPRYEVPAGSGKHSLFAGSLWIGGLDSNGQLKISAMRFRQNGVDFWPGPISTGGPDFETNQKQVCRDFDRHFIITKEQVAEFRKWFECTQNPNCNDAEDFPGYTIPDIILNWPAHGPPGGYDYHLAPFWDTNSDGYYNPMDGDFPFFEFPSDGITDDPECLRPRNRKPKLYGDKTLWWVYNDRSNLHTETGGDPIGLEIRAQAFAFNQNPNAKNDHLGSSTFYHYNIINRSTFILYDTYIAKWADPDVGSPLDDYVGSDVQRGLGYAYNGSSYDPSTQGITGYGSYPPAIGIRFFEGPYKDEDGTDNPKFDSFGEQLCNESINGLNFGDGIIDNERLGMTRFIYFNNTSQGSHSATTDPMMAIDYYKYLIGFWKDGTPLCYGGTGHFSGGCDINVSTRFAFPGNSDPCGWGQNGVSMPEWTEQTEHNPPDDRRFLISSGPFTLKPGAVNDITVGAIWAQCKKRAGAPYNSVEKMKKSSDFAQLLFDNCFRVITPPDAPKLNIIELNRKLIFHIYNKPSSNNYLEQYKEKNTSFLCTDQINPCDEYYRFQGYQIFQVKNPGVSMEDKHNHSLVREVFQCDIEDNLDKIINFSWDEELQIMTGVVEVDGNNKGIVNTFVLKHDAFSDSNQRLVNNREYYFTAIAYATNNSMVYNQSSENGELGNTKPYLASKNSKIYTAIPHMSEPDGTILQSGYGDKPQIIQLEGFGNADNILELTQETIDEIMSGYPWKAEQIKYKSGYGPINVKIIDPLNVKGDDYILKFINPDTNLRGTIGTTGSNLHPSSYLPFEYMIINSAGDTVFSDFMVQFYGKHERIIPDWGISISISQSGYSGFQSANQHYRNGFLYASMEFDNPERKWLEFIPDGTEYDAFNWIRVGKNRSLPHSSDPCLSFSGYDDYLGFDDDRHFANILGGTWAPYKLTSTYRYGSAHASVRGIQNITGEERLSSVDLVITTDKSKWTRSAIVEMCENEWEITAECPNHAWDVWREVQPRVNHLSEGNALKFALRQSPSVGKDGNPDNSGTHGLGWFPGYAIDVQTGERLNIVFGEDSWLVGDNGNDMIWNPTSNILDDFGKPIFGGKHFIYIMGHTFNPENPDRSGNIYDSCRVFHSKMLEYEQSGQLIEKINAWQSAMWVGMPILNNEYELLDNDVTIKLRVATPYYQAKGSFAKNNPINDNFPTYKFSTKNFQTIHNDEATAKSALNLIRVVPNPYMGYNLYETNHFNHYVRITNIPQRCVVTIYNINGRLIRQFDKDDSAPFLQWDLRDNSGNEIKGGAYIIHINAFDLGEKVLKWFGVLQFN